MEMLWLVLILVAVSFMINILTVFMQKIIDVNCDEHQKGLAKEITTSVLKFQRFNSTLLPLAALFYVFMDRYYVGIILMGLVVTMQVISLIRIIIKAKQNNIPLKIVNSKKD
ncbi:hypothetical protein PRVXT_001205 [Proteinivorax tanatarense]|uniref:Uncharacterized protein n=1 Tax=Proteinivorax tanatarense TaxID=1260629 RepID=A0AAU7VQD6_9FIRM